LVTATNSAASPLPQTRIAITGRRYRIRLFRYILLKNCNENINKGIKYLKRAFIIIVAFA